MKSLHDAQRNVLKGRWRRVYGALFTLTPSGVMRKLVAWWRGGRPVPVVAALKEAVHVHHHEMTFPHAEERGRELEWVFVCRCGHTTTRIEEAQP